jgi:hypothetical protein
MRSKPATRENSDQRRDPAASRFRAALLAALPMALMAAVAAPPAGAQTATSTSGNVGSAASRNGYPAAGGAIVLPAPAASGNATTATGTTATTGTTGLGGAASGSSAGGSSGSSGGGRTGTASAGGAARSAGTGGGGAHWVLCPPTGTGLAPLFTGTDLSCTPD